MKYVETVNNNRGVISNSNDGKTDWSSRLYVDWNKEKIATLTSAEHKTLNGAIKWAKKALKK